MKKLSVNNMALACVFTALIAAGAFIKIPIPVVPFTLQLLFTTLAGLLLGSNIGALSVGVYVVLGLIGIPIFASGGGISYIFNPTFGYLLGFCLGAFVTGKIAYYKASFTLKRLLIASFAGLFTVYFVGMIYYYFIANFYLNSPIGVWSLILYCFILAVPGDILLCILASILAKRLIPVIKRGR